MHVVGFSECRFDKYGRKVGDLVKIECDLTEPPRADGNTTTQRDRAYAITKVAVPRDSVVRISQIQGNGDVYTIDHKGSFHTISSDIVYDIHPLELLAMQADDVD